MKFITQADIREYKKMMAKNWRDESWYEFMGSLKSEAIGYAIGVREKGESIKETQKNGNNYLAN